MSRWVGNKSVGIVSVFSLPLRSDQTGWLTGGWVDDNKNQGKCNAAPPFPKRWCGKPPDKRSQARAFCPSLSPERASPFLDSVRFLAKLPEKHRGESQDLIPDKRGRSLCRPRPSKSQPQLTLLLLHTTDCRQQQQSGEGGGMQRGLLCISGTSLLVLVERCLGSVTGVPGY